LPASDSESGGIHAFGHDSSRVEIGRGSGGLKLCGFRFLAAALFTALLLVGCVPVPVVGWTPVFVGGPTAGSADLKQPDYSLGPVSSDQFPDLVKNAIPPSEGAVHLAGRVELLLLSDNRTYILDAVGSLTDAGIALLRWYEPEKQYRILARIPYSHILSLSSNRLGFGRRSNCVWQRAYLRGEIKRTQSASQPPCLSSSLRVRIMTWRRPMLPSSCCRKGKRQLKVLVIRPLKVLMGASKPCPRDFLHNPIDETLLAPRPGSGRKRLTCRCFLSVPAPRQQASLTACRNR